MSIKMYPNPFHDHIQITIDTPSSLKIYDTYGKIYHEQLLFSDNKINVSDLPTGMYYIEIINKLGSKQFIGIKE